MSFSLKLLLPAVLALACASCSNGEGQKEVNEPAKAAVIPPSKVRLDQICQTFANNDFRGLIHLTLNYKDKPLAYQQQLINMLKQHAAEREKGNLHIAQIRPSQVITKTSEKLAEVYLDISYSSGISEEIVLPMIYDNGNWWIK